MKIFNPHLNAEPTANQYFYWHNPDWFCVVKHVDGDYVELIDISVNPHAAVGPDMDSVVFLNNHIICFCRYPINYLMHSGGPCLKRRKNHDPQNEERIKKIVRIARHCKTADDFIVMFKLENMV